MKVSRKHPARSYYVHRSPEAAQAVGLPYCITPDATPPEGTSRILVCLTQSELNDMITNLREDGHYVTLFIKEAV